MILTRRNIIKRFAAQSLAWAFLPALLSVGSEKKPPPFMRGINTYYLLVEAYRYVEAKGGTNISALVYEYLVDKLKLPTVQERCSINAIRYWAFNDYPDPGDGIRLHTTDGRLWKNSQHLDQQAFAVLASITEVLGDLGFSLIPVLSNYWPSFGGILQYLVWTGEVSRQEYIEVLCRGREAELYLDYTLRFFLSPQVESLYREHINQILPLFSNNRSVRIIELMNEPRGKNPYSLANKPLPNGRMSSDIVATWLNRQAIWLQKNPNLKNRCPLISSGEEGWLEKPLQGISLKSLARGGQYYEGIDLAKNISRQTGGINIASIHMYTHMATKLKAINSCGDQFIDQRGWAHLSNNAEKTGSFNDVDLADDWILSRAHVLQNEPWYIGEMAWPWREAKQFSDDFKNCSSLKTYHALYQHWERLARENGAQGIFLWMLDGLQHKDRFYGMDHVELAQMMTGKSV